MTLRSRLQPTNQPGARGAPIALDGDCRHAKHFGDFILTQAAKEPQLDDACGAWVGLFELGQDFVERDEICR